LNSEAKHLSKFESGAVRFYKKGYVDSNGIETIGNGEMFSAPLDEFNAAYKAHNGDLKKMEIDLGFEPGYMSSNPEQFKVAVIQAPNIRLANGNEAGAYDGYWAPGGFTDPGGISEAVIDSYPDLNSISTYEISDYKNLWGIPDE
jgi:hypothetical protein